MTRETDTHIYFWKSNFPLTQWYKREFFDTDTGLLFNCVEQGHMFYKAKLFNDNEIAEQILKEKHPSTHLKLGRVVKNFNNETWLLSRNTILLKLHYSKLTQHEDLKNFILNTGNKILVEASPIDLIYGVGLHEDDPLILDSNNWRGTNLLGNILMQVRDILKNEQ